MLLLSNAYPPLKNRQQTQEQTPLPTILSRTHGRRSLNTSTTSPTFSGPGSHAPLRPPVRAFCQSQPRSVFTIQAKINLRDEMVQTRSRESQRPNSIDFRESVAQSRVMSRDDVIRAVARSHIIVVISLRQFSEGSCRARAKHADENKL